MGFESVALFSIVDMHVDAPVGGVLGWFTDLPGNVLVQRYSVAIPATIGRRTVRLKLPGPSKGTLYYPQIMTGGVLRLYGMRVYARVLPGDWQWYTVPVIETGEWQAMKLPIPGTSEEWQSMKLPIAETPEGYSAMKLPIAETPEAYAAMKLPIPDSPVTPEWVPVQVDE